MNQVDLLYTLQKNVITTVNGVVGYIKNNKQPHEKSYGLPNTLLATRYVSADISHYIEEWYYASDSMSKCNRKEIKL